MAAPVTIVILALAFALGLAVGSFANVVIARVPKGESILHPPSHCPSCGAPVRPRDNVPVVSWIAAPGPVPRLRLAHPGPLPPRRAGRRPPRPRDRRHRHRSAKGANWNAA